MVGLLGVLFCSEELGKESLINASAGFVQRGLRTNLACGLATWLRPSYVAATWLWTGMACGLAILRSRNCLGY